MNMVKRYMKKELSLKINFGFLDGTMRAVFKPGVNQTIYINTPILLNFNQCLFYVDLNIVCMANKNGKSATLACFIVLVYWKN